MPIGVKVTLRKERMYEFLERLICSALPRIRDFKGINSKLDGKGNYTLGLEEQIIFPEIVMDSVHKIMGMNITFVTSANTDEEGFALLREFGLPFKKELKTSEMAKESMKARGGEACKIGRKVRCETSKIKRGR